MATRRYLSLPWNDWYQLAKIYYVKQNHLLVPANYETKDGYKLGKWIERQRSMYRKNSHLLNDYKILLLEKIGMEWQLENRYPWDFWITLCHDYIEEFGNLNPRKKSIYKGVPFGEWISQQRKRIKEGTLAQERKDELLSLNMAIGNRTRRKWEDWYQIAEDYYHKNGHLNVKVNYVDELGNRIGLWVYVQKEKYRHKRIPYLKRGQINKLNKLHIRW